MKKQILLILFVGVGFLFFAKINLASADGPTSITGNIKTPTVWGKTGSPYIIKRDVHLEAPLTIEPGTVIKIESGRSLNVSNEFSAIGTEDEKIVFTSWKDDSFGGDTNNDGNSTVPAPGDWYSIVAGTPTKSAVMEHVVILYGANGLHGLVSITGNDNTVIRNSELKYGEFAGIVIRDSLPIIEGNLIANNNVGVAHLSSSTEKVPVLRNNAIENNTTGAITCRKLDARYNWWGDKTGPYYDTNYNDVEKNLEGKGNPVYDGVMFKPWLGESLERKIEPVILIPGIGASINLDLMIGGIFNDNWMLLSHTYDGIVEALKGIGYKENENLFICYYDWRKSNAESAEKFLKPLIAKANALNGTSKVNIIAHSMGGLVARSYVQENDYAFDIDNLILVATPNKGASDVYPVWEGGHIPKNWENNIIMQVYLAYMSAKKITLSNYETVHKYIPSVKELMPTYDYIYPKGSPGSKVRYAQMNEKNDFLINLNKTASSINNKLVLSVISGTSQDTVNGIPIIDSDDEELWIDGKPDPIDPEKNDSNGDGRVLLSSSEIKAFSQYKLNYNHGDIVSEAEKIIAQQIEDNLDTIYPAPDVEGEIGFWFASPVDVEIKDPSGKIISKNTNTIPLAKYASESKSDGFKLVSIPNPVPGDYEINIIGNGVGEYHIGSVYADYTGEKQDKSSVVSGEIGKGKSVEYKLTYDPDNPEGPTGNIELSDIKPPAITINSPKKENYLSNISVKVDYSISDEDSGVDDDKTQVLFDEREFVESEIDLSLQHLGSHKFSVSAADQAGNSDESEVNFNVYTNINAIINNVKHYYNLGLITDPKVAIYLQVRLRIIHDFMNALKQAEEASLPNHAKDVIMENIKNNINNQIGLLMMQIGKKKGLKDGINPDTRDLLIEKLNSIQP